MRLEHFNQLSDQYQGRSDVYYEYTLVNRASLEHGVLEALSADRVGMDLARGQYAVLRNNRTLFPLGRRWGRQVFHCVDVPPDQAWTVGHQPDGTPFEHVYRLEEIGGNGVTVTLLETRGRPLRPPVSTSDAVAQQAIQQASVAVIKSFTDLIQLEAVDIKVLRELHDLLGQVIRQRTLNAPAQETPKTAWERNLELEGDE